MNGTRVLNEHDIYLFQEGTAIQLGDVMGAHMAEDRGGVNFAVWAPNADYVSVAGDFNGWHAYTNPLHRAGGGVWNGFVPGVQPGAHYKYHITAGNGFAAEKADPFGFFHEVPPNTASIVWDLGYEWQDGVWMSRRRAANGLDAPMSIYEVHLGSWRRVPEEGLRSLSYRELADQLVPYVKEMGFTHVEFLPVMEHPFFGSWGYQTTGFFAPSSRFGTPQDLMHLIDRFHAEGIGVILDWVPSHFPKDAYALGYFDGAHEFEPQDPRRATQPDWNSYVFEYGRREVSSFLLSSAMFWLDRYHVDGIRVDAVASMLYLDYSRKPGEWTPNIHGGHENLEAVDFLRRLNADIYRVHGDTQTIAEESTSWPGVSRPVFDGGLGFGFKWDMGWMHDTLEYMAQDPVYRKYRHGQLTFRMVYAFNENFVLPLSHDEVVYGKKSLISKMPGDDWRKFANLRLLFAYMYAQPGKKLLFMGGEFGQWSEWNHDGSLDWHLLRYEPHAHLRLLLGDLNHAYRTQPALHVSECTPAGFEWLDANDGDHNVLTFMRKGPSETDTIVVACNFSPETWDNYRIGVPGKGTWHEILNSDSKQYSGSGQGNFGGVETAPVPWHGRAYSITVKLPPLGAIFLMRNR